MTDNLSDPIILQLNRKLYKELLCLKNREAKSGAKKVERIYLMRFLDHQ